MPNSYIHLGFDNSADLAAMLIRNGAGAVSSYNDRMRQSHNMKVVSAMVDVFLQSQNNTAGDAGDAVANQNLDTDKFTASYYKNTKWELEKKNVTSQFQTECSLWRDDLVLWDDTPPLVPVDPGNQKVYITALSYYVEAPTTSTEHIEHVTVTIRNDTDQPVTQVGMSCTFTRAGYTNIPGQVGSFWLDGTTWPTLPANSETTVTFTLRNGKTSDALDMEVKAYTLWVNGYSHSSDQYDTWGWIDVQEEEYVKVDAVKQ